MAGRLDTERMTMGQLVARLDRELGVVESRICPGRAVGELGYAVKRARALLREIRFRGWQGSLFDLEADEARPLGKR